MEVKFVEQWNFWEEQTRQFFFVMNQRICRVACCYMLRRSRRKTWGEKGMSWIWFGTWWKILKCWENFLLIFLLQRKICSKKFLCFQGIPAFQDFAKLRFFDMLVFWSANHIIYLPSKLWIHSVLFCEQNLTFEWEYFVNSVFTVKTI